MYSNWYKYHNQALAMILTFKLDIGFNSFLGSWGVDDILLQSGILDALRQGFSCCTSHVADENCASAKRSNRIASIMRLKAFISDDDLSRGNIWTVLKDGTPVKLGKQMAVHSPPLTTASYGLPSLSELRMITTTNGAAAWFRREPSSRRADGGRTTAIGLRRQSSTPAMPLRPSSSFATLDRAWGGNGMVASSRRHFLRQGMATQRAAVEASRACRRHRPSRPSFPFGKETSTTSPVCGVGERNTPFRRPLPFGQAATAAADVAAFLVSPASQQ
nr:hypothetical protein Iba_chr04aCG17570 [Ipomoea batatas]